MAPCVPTSAILGFFHLYYSGSASIPNDFPGELISLFEDVLAFLEYGKYPTCYLMHSVISVSETTLGNQYRSQQNILQEYTAFNTSGLKYLWIRTDPTSLRYEPFQRSLPTPKSITVVRFPVNFRRCQLSRPATPILTMKACGTTGFPNLNLPIGPRDMRIHW